MDVPAVEPRQAEVEHDERGECLFDLPERVPLRLRPPPLRSRLRATPSGTYRRK
jgi:hypothetical protein